VDDVGHVHVVGDCQMQLLELDFQHRVCLYNVIHFLRFTNTVQLVV